MSTPTLAKSVRVTTNALEVNGEPFPYYLAAEEVRVSITDQGLPVVYLPLIAETLIVEGDVVAP